MRVLVVEDFEVLARSIGTGLRREGMAVDVVLDGDDALSHLALTRYDVVVLDRDLPGVHGDEICRRIVAEDSGSRILMLTAASTVKERVDGLGLGADDYLPKPFEVPELVARVQALVRRDKVNRSLITRIDDLEIDRSKRTVTRAGKEVRLTVQDDGSGFDPQTATAKKDHWGMRGMRERANSIGATFMLDAAPGRGTRIEIVVPRKK